MPRPIDGLAAIFYAGVLAVYGYLAFSGFYPAANPWPSGVIIAAAILVLMVIDRLEYRYMGEQPPWPAILALLLVRLVIIVTASFSSSLGLASYHTIFLLLIPFSFFFLAGSSYGLSGMVWTMYLVGRWHSPIGGFPTNDPPLLFYLTFSLMLAFIASIAYLIRQERTSRLQAEKLLHELEDSHWQLQKYAEKVGNLAVTEERNRLAREIHDSLGHYMTVVNVQLEKAIAFRDRNPQEADQAVKDAKHLASEALKDVRRSVGTLRNPPEFLLSQSLRDLVNNMNTDQFAIELKVEGEEAGFSRQSLLTLYRAAQEGLTNIQKHAQANQATIRLQLKNHEAQLWIEDNGQGFDPTILEGPKLNGHYGLEGVRERLELIRGSFTLESRPNEGTRLCVTVPKNPLALANVPGH
ncbi:MAG TPA: sensor histidine kinase [Anaerolineae bacterium]